MCMLPKKDYVSYWNTSIDQRIISPVHEENLCSSENTPGIVQVGSSGRYGIDLVGVGIEAAIIAMLVGLVLLLRFRYKPQTTEGRRWRRAGCWTLSAFAILFVSGVGLVTMHRLGVFGMI